MTRRNELEDSDNTLPQKSLSELLKDVEECVWNERDLCQSYFELEDQSRLLEDDTRSCFVSPCHDSESDVNHRSLYLL